MKTGKKEEKPSLSSDIGKKELRKLRAKKRGAGSVWAGLAVFGLIGWSVVVPTLGGILLGLWLDKHYPVKFSWTATCLITGLILGCINAWRWVSKENKQIQKEQEDNHE